MTRCGRTRRDVGVRLGGGAEMGTSLGIWEKQGTSFCDQLSFFTSSLLII